jgi:acyl-CoA thioesterase I
VRRLYGINMRRSTWRMLLVEMGALLVLFNVATGSGIGRAQSAADTPIKIVAFGDSLTAGYLLPPNEAFPVVLAKALAARGHKVEILNAGVSGDTTAAGRDRIAWAVPPETEAVILELGANDALRGLDPGKARENLEWMITTIKAQGADILLAGMVAPSSMGEAYFKPFDAMYPALAQKHGLLLYPLFIEATALKPDLNLPDGLHPNAKGVVAIVASILPRAEELIARVKARRAAKG